MKRKQNRSPIGKLALEEHEFREKVRRNNERLRRGLTPLAKDFTPSLETLLNPTLDPQESDGDSN